MTAPKAFNAVSARYFPDEDRFLGRTTVGVADLSREARVEIELVCIDAAHSRRNVPMSKVLDDVSAAHVATDDVDWTAFRDPAGSRLRELN